jgi:hypothetical protein
MKTRGGKRKGAGRKPRSEPKEAFTVRLESDIAEKFKRLCEENELSQSAQFAEMVKQTGE